MRLLVVKMSSLGDVVHTLTAVTDAAHAVPNLEVDWVIEEAYTAIPTWHSAVRRVIPVALRRWRRSPWAMLRDKEWFQFRSELRRHEYDLILDAQGLMKSGWIGLQARGLLVGRSRSTAREPLAAAFYKRSLDIDLDLPEVEQVRQLFARAVGYAYPASPADFGVDLTRVARGHEGVATAVLAHGAAWENKLWPVECWIALGKELSAQGLKVLLPWGDEGERSRAGIIANACSGEILPKLGVAEVAETLAAAQLVVGLDTGLTHIAIALGRPTITLYGPSVPVYGEVAANNVIHLTSTSSKVVDTSRKNSVELEAVLRATRGLLRTNR